MTSLRGVTAAVVMGIALLGSGEATAGEQARVEQQDLQIVPQIWFARGQALLAPDSLAILHEVAAVLRDHPEIAAIAIEGHASQLEPGDAADRWNLSLRRAMAVKRWLVVQGIAAERLVLVAYGTDRPIAVDTKANPTGAARNRWVSLSVLAVARP